MSVFPVANKSRTLGRTHSPMTRGIIAVTACLLVLGLLNLYSATMAGPHFYAQLRHVAIGFVLFAVTGWAIPARHWNTYAYYIYAFTCLSLVIVLFLGHAAGGAQRWMNVGPIRFQPSEFAKLTVAITVSRYFYTNRVPHPYRIREMWIILLMVGIIFGLIFDQPDLGTGGFCMLIALIQLAFLRIDRKTILWAASGAVAVAVVGWAGLLRDYQKQRILSLLNPSFDPYGAGYHAQQSLIAIGSGGLWGKGFLQGTQTQLQFLPARHTDFIFSVFAEEHGFWMATITFILFGFYAYFGLNIARQAKNSFNSLLAVGATFVVFLEFAINVAMVLGIFPVVGVPLPFFSHGGSSIFTVCIATGLLIAVDRENTGATRVNKGYRIQET